MLPGMRRAEQIGVPQNVRIMQFNKDLIAASSSPLVLAILAEAEYQVEFDRMIHG